MKPEHPLQWLADPLVDEPTFALKSWFGGRTIMLNGLHHLFLTAQGEPWQGVLVCTFHEHHESLRAEFPALGQHPVLGKWLYLPESAETFERDARRSCSLCEPATRAWALLLRRKRNVRIKKYTLETSCEAVCPRLRAGGRNS